MRRPGQPWQNSAGFVDDEEDDDDEDDHRAEQAPSDSIAAVAGGAPVEVAVAAPTASVPAGVQEGPPHQQEDLDSPKSALDPPTDCPSDQLLAYRRRMESQWAAKSKGPDNDAPISEQEPAFEPPVGQQEKAEDGQRDEVSAPSSKELTQDEFEGIRRQFEQALRMASDTGKHTEAQEEGDQPQEREHHPDVQEQLHQQEQMPQQQKQEEQSQQPVEAEDQQLSPKVSSSTNSQKQPTQQAQQRSESELEQRRVRASPEPSPRSQTSETRETQEPQAQDHSQHPELSESPSQAPPPSHGYPSASPPVVSALAHPPAIPPTAPAAGSAPAPAPVVGTAVEPASGTARELRQQLRSMARESQRLQDAYQAEVERAAELGSLLDEFEAADHAKSAAQEQELVHLEQELKAKEAERRSELEIAEKETETVGIRVRDQEERIQQLKQRLLRGAERLQRCAAAPEALRDALLAADEETHDLRRQVGHQESILKQRKDDFRAILDFMYTTNIKASGGYRRDLKTEDLLPQAVRSHLDFSPAGLQEVAKLDEKFLSRVRTEAYAAKEKFKPVGSDLGSQRTLFAPSVSKLPSPLEEALESADEGEEEGQGTSKAQRVRTFRAPAAASMKEECEILRRSLREELRLIDCLLSPPPDPSFFASVPTGNEKQKVLENCRLFLRSVAFGELGEVRNVLPDCAPGGLLKESPDELMGWTAWHVAAAYGQSKVLEVLKEDLVAKSGHHRTVLGSPTFIGFSPFAVACLTDQLEVAKSLLRGMAPVDGHDRRGNTPLMWASMSSEASDLVPLLLSARADPEASNFQGLKAELAPFLPYGDGPELTTKTLFFQEGDDSLNKGGQPYHCLRAIGSDATANPEGTGFLSAAWQAFKAPLRNRLKFPTKLTKKQTASAQLSDAELEAGFWSDWVTHYTHAGLLAAVQAGRMETDPAAPKNSQALVLTCERLLFFDARSWELQQVVALSGLQSVTTSPYSESLFVLRLHHGSDLLLDTAPAVRSRLMEELQFATRIVAALWGGDDFNQSLQIDYDTSNILSLLDDERSPAGTLAFLEKNVFLLLPYNPRSAFLVDSDTFYFGLLDMYCTEVSHRGAPEWRWQTYFFILKSGAGEARRLIWCLHPNDELGVGELPLIRLQTVQALDTPDGEACLILDAEAADEVVALTLRAPHAQLREDWIVSLRTMIAGR